MNRSQFFFTLTLLVCLAASFAAGQAMEKHAMTGVPAQYSATAFGQAGASAGKSFGLNIYVDDVTADGDRDELLALLKNKGPDALVSKMEGIKDKGRIAPDGSVGTGVRVVRIRPTADGGQRIILVTNRPISFRELYNGNRSTDYKFGYVVLNLDKDGKGTGTFAPLCKVRFNKKGELEVENYGQKPYRLANVRREK